MKSLWTLAVLALCGAAFAAQSLPSQMPPTVRRPIRIPIRSADPWYVKAMLEGLSPSAPEISTLLNVSGGQGGQRGNQGPGGPAGPGAPGVGQGRGLMPNGHFVVNPTDNSLWWYPD